MHSAAADGVVRKKKAFAVAIGLGLLGVLGIIAVAVTIRLRRPEPVAATPTPATPVAASPTAATQQATAPPQPHRARANRAGQERPDRPSGHRSGRPDATECREERYRPSPRSWRRSELRVAMTQLILGNEKGARKMIKLALDTDPSLQSKVKELTEQIGCGDHSARSRA